jgi:hypothetical protein
MRLPRHQFATDESCTEEPPVIDPSPAAPSRYRVDATPAGYRIVRVSGETGYLDGLDAVMHRLREVAEAYAAAAAALEAYLASLDRSEDASELFETWRDLDDRYELLAIERRDWPMIVAAPVLDLWSPTSDTRH